MKKINVEIMLMNYVSKLITSGQVTTAKMLINAKENVIEKIENHLGDLECLGQYEIGTIDIYTIGNWWGIERISIFKDNKFLTNIL